MSCNVYELREFMILHTEILPYLHCQIILDICFSMNGKPWGTIANSPSHIVQFYIARTATSAESFLSDGSITVWPDRLSPATTIASAPSTV